MTLPGGPTSWGIVIGATILLAMIILCAWRLFIAIVDELRRYCDISHEWPFAGDPAHDHAAADDAQSLHGGLTAAETSGQQSRKSAEATGAVRHG